MQTAESTCMPLNTRVLTCRYCRAKQIIRNVPASLYAQHLERCHPDVFEKWQNETRSVS
jgi:hypothetical protein